jgi:hypothetical protein
MDGVEATVSMLFLRVNPKFISIFKRALSHFFVVVFLVTASRAGLGGIVFQSYLEIQDVYLKVNET